jgi:hypothetical protein
MIEPKHGPEPLRQTRRRFIATAVAMVLASIVIIFGSRNFVHSIYRTRTRVALAQQYRQIYTAYMTYWSRRGSELAALPMPDGESGLGEWTRQIGSHFGYPVPVFTRDDGVLSWITDAPAAEVVSGLPKALGAISDTSRHALRELGAVQIRGIHSLRTAHNLYWVWLLRRTSDEREWGIVQDNEAEWRTFFHELGAKVLPRDLPFLSPTWILQDQIATPTAVTPDQLTQLKVFLGDSVPFVSPNLDPKLDSVHADYLDGPHVEFYAAKNDYDRFEETVLLGSIWFFAFFPWLFLIPIYRSYRSVRKLTEPDTSALQ